MGEAFGEGENFLGPHLREVTNFGRLSAMCAY